MTHAVEDLIDGSVELASLPSIFYQINEAVENPETSFAQLAQIISNDSALSARLLRLVNSSYFGFSSEIETITHAVTIVGMAQLRDLALATSVVSSFKGVPRDVVDMHSFWCHSIASGLAARVVSVYRNESNPERYYLTGLLHDVGRLLLYITVPDEMTKVFERYKKGSLLHESERDVLRLDHTDVGGALMKKWNLPDSLVHAVQYHHRPMQAGTFTVEASISHLGDILAHALEIGSSGERSVPPLDTKAWEVVGLPSSLLSSILAQVDRQVDEVIKIFM